ncbi:MAG: T9SS type A sorting domain-containing protein [Bacteroidia bacterium]|nr:T9SS type A sorting domain-containing protein [Bacteroidia bacterium]MBP7245007.1 T9SS type A sorting domain-containing protein [Bacteroidia bacterium]
MNVKHAKLIITLIVFNLSGLNAQFTNNNWCFGDSAGVRFDNSILFKSSSAVKRGTVSISDSNGDLIFYGSTADVQSSSTGQLKRGKLFNKVHFKMNNGDSLTGVGWSHDMLILPKSILDSTFYVFVAGVVVPDTGLWYSIVDMKLQGGLGQVVQKNVRYINHPIQDMLTAVRHGNGKDWWLITRRWNAMHQNPSNEFRVYLVDSNGINSPVIQYVGTQQYNNAGDMSFNAIGNKVALCGYANYLGLFDFNRCTGQISNEILIEPNIGLPYKFYTSVIFSPDGSKLYVNSSQEAYQQPGKLYQFDLSAANISASRIIIDSFPIPAENSGMEMGPDGKIYISCVFDSIGSSFPYPPNLFNAYNSNLSVINQPDSLGLACDFQPFSFYLGGARTYYGLPNNPDYELGAWVGSPCDTLTVGQAENDEKNDVFFQAWYNPEWNMIHVNASKLKGKSGVLRLFDVEGRVVVERKVDVISGGYFTTEIGMNGIAAGVYIVSLVTEKDKTQGKILKY